MATVFDHRLGSDRPMQEEVMEAPRFTMTALASMPATPEPSGASTASCSAGPSGATSPTG